MKPWNICTAACVLAFASTSFAAVPSSAFYVGLGGSANSVNVNQDLYASGVSNVYASNGTTLIAYGEAGGPASPFKNTQFTLAPELQTGYYKHFDNSTMLWGVNFVYRYLGSTATNKPVDVPQYGSFTNTGSAPPDTSFSGNVVIDSSQMNVNHEFALMPFIGQSFTNSFIYLGAGPALLGTTTNIDGVTGYADINGTHANITGASTNFSSNNWRLGGSVETGMAYYIDPTWFLDFNYSFAITGWHTNSYSAPFSSSTTSGGTTYIDTGTLYVNTSQRVITQAFSITMNKAF